MRAAFEPVSLQEAGEKGRKLAMSQLKIGRSPVLLTLKGTLSTDGITLLQSEEYGDKYSFGIRLETSDDVEAIETLLNGLDQVDADTDFGEWVTRPLFKNEILYLKAKLDKSGKKFNFTSNEKVAPKKPNPSTVMRDMPIVVTATASAYFGTEDLTRGLTFDVKHVEFLPETQAMDIDPASDEESEGPLTQEATTPTPATNRRASLQPPPKPAKTQVSAKKLRNLTRMMAYMKDPDRYERLRWPSPETRSDRFLFPVVRRVSGGRAGAECAHGVRRVSVDTDVSKMHLSAAVRRMR